MRTISIDGFVAHLGLDPSVISTLESESLSNSVRFDKLRELVTASDCLDSFLDGFTQQSRARYGKAETLKSAGNALFGKRKFAEAIQKYNQALSCVDPADTELQSIVLQNRSTCLFKLGFFERAEQDALDALHCRPQYTKAMCRLGECQTELQQPSAALRLLEKLSEDSLTSSARECLEKLRQNQDLAVDCRRASNSSSPGSDSQVFEPPRMCCDIEVSENEIFGRFVQVKSEATSRTAGCELLSEEAFACVLNRTHYGQRCEHCFAAFDPSAHGWFVPSLSFCGAAYCSLQCRNRAQRHHNVLYQNTSIVRHLPEETQLSLAILLNRHHSDYDLVRSLQTHEHQIPPAATIEFQFQALVCEHVFGCQVFDAGEVLHHLRQTRTNTHAVTGIQADSQGGGVEGVSQVRLAMAIFAQSSMLNHSCAPDSRLEFSGRRIRVVAIKTVEPGQQIFSCYGPRQDSPVEQRRKNLADQYFFECQCWACESHLAQARLSDFLCPSCGTRLHTASAKPNLLECPSCGASSQLDEMRRQQKACAQMELTFDTPKLAVRSLQNVLEKQRRLLHANHKAIAKTCDHIARCCSMAGDWHKAAEFCQESVDILATIFGDESRELVAEKVKLARLTFNAGPGHFATVHIQQLVRESIALVRRSQCCAEELGDLRAMLQQLDQELV